MFRMGKVCEATAAGGVTGGVVGGAGDVGAVGLVGDVTADWSAVAGPSLLPVQPRPRSTIAAKADTTGNGMAAARRVELESLQENMVNLVQEY